MEKLVYFVNPQSISKFVDNFSSFVAIIPTNHNIKYDLIIKGVKYYNLDNYFSLDTVRKVKPYVICYEGESVDEWKSMCSELGIHYIPVSDMFGFGRSVDTNRYQCEFPIFNISMIDVENTKLMKSVKQSIRKINYEARKREYINSIKKSSNRKTTNYDSSNE